MRIAVPAEIKPSEQRVAITPAGDDNADAADGLARLLRLGGHEVRVAHVGTDALAVAEEMVIEGKSVGVVMGLGSHGIAVSFARRITAAIASASVFAVSARR